MRRLATAAGTTGLTAAGGLGWALLERHWYALRQHSIEVLPAGAEPLTVLHVSDLHLVASQRRAIAWVRSLARLEPDLVVNTGDNFGSADALDAVLEAYEPLTQLPGCFVFGSNDYFGPHPKNPARYLLPDARRSHGKHRPKIPLPAAALAGAWRDAGWADLSNARADVRLGGLQVALVGMDDPHMERDVLPGPQPGGDLCLGVVHAPYRRALDALVGDGSQVIFAGHTHGGQLCLPGFGTLVTNCDLDRRRAKGLHWYAPSIETELAADAAPHAGAAGAWLHVSAGLGTSPYAPVRFACRPEATLVTLLPRQA